MGQLFTHGAWTAKPGHEDRFVAAWTEIAEWTSREVPGSNWAKLLRAHGADNRFISFGPWDSLEAIEHWRALDGFQARVQQLLEHLDGFEPSTLEVVSEIE